MVSKARTFSPTSCGKSDIGLIRTNNEDSWLVDHSHNIFILCDGMGGHLAGEIASQEAVAAFASLVRKQQVADDRKSTLKKKLEQLRAVIQGVNASVYDLGKSDRELRGMGTTLCCVYFHRSTMIVGHVGDSRVYLLREGELSLLTQDHSLMLEMLELGELHRRDVRDCAYKNIITRAIGVSPLVEPALQTVEMADGDRILLCSDGLSDMLSSSEIEAIINKNSTEQRAVDQLLFSANKKGGNDNITAILITLRANDEY